MNYSIKHLLILMVVSALAALAFTTTPWGAGGIALTVAFVVWVRTRHDVECQTYLLCSMVIGTMIGPFLILAYWFFLGMVTSGKIRRGQGAVIPPEAIAGCVLGLGTYGGLVFGFVLWQSVVSKRDRGATVHLPSGETESTSP
jgi:hypothetical protein